MIAQFITPLRLEDVDGSEGILIEPLKFYSAELRGMVIAPAGFCTDFASLPRGLWNIFPKRGKQDKAAVLHDAAYRGALVTIAGDRMHLVKGLADDLFLEAMVASGVGAFTRTAFYRAVVWFGGRAYANGQRLKVVATDEQSV